MPSWQCLEKCEWELWKLRLKYTWCEVTDQETSLIVSELSVCCLFLKKNKHENEHGTYSDLLSYVDHEQGESLAVNSSFMGEKKEN